MLFFLNISYYTYAFEIYSKNTVIMISLISMDSSELQFHGNSKENLHEGCPQRSLYLTINE